MSLLVELEDGRMGGSQGEGSAGLNGAGIVGDQGGTGRTTFSYESSHVRIRSRQTINTFHHTRLSLHVEIDDLNSTP